MIKRLTKYTRIWRYWPSVKMLRYSIYKHHMIIVKLLFWLEGRKSKIKLILKNFMFSKKCKTVRHLKWRWFKNFTLMILHAFNSSLTSKIQTSFCSLQQKTSSDWNTLCNQIPKWRTCTHCTTSCWIHLHSESSTKIKPNVLSLPKKIFFSSI